MNTVLHCKRNQKAKSSWSQCHYTLLGCHIFSWKSCPFFSLWTILGFILTSACWVFDICQLYEDFGMWFHRTKEVVHIWFAASHGAIIKYMHIWIVLLGMTATTLERVSCFLFLVSYADHDGMNTVDSQSVLHSLSCWCTKSVQGLFQVV